ncbi:HlyD family secretion protein [Nostoc sp. DedQUE09]|uniref:HlyD family secretion protein n=1 Tax=Nostoc sp. DedQUE09 TaxID=3075394 RepID=UPI002AD453B5|nr:HlyD family efflux transporter periplasmic adaptor subunit [Nostoc sp. DedQUE09]MDZ7953418.1 HlyD family efflux transporter periplasmic adaptor subunit [Nostoc sp. DedQUE09]
MLETENESYNSKQAPSNSIESAETDNSQLQLSPQQPKKPRLKIVKPIIFVAAIALLGSLGYVGYRQFLYKPQPNGLFLSGRIEGYETDISSKTGGKIGEVVVKEGDFIQPGQLLVKIDDTDLRAQLQGTQARINAEKQRLEHARQQIPVLQAELDQANLITQQAKQESEGRVLEAKNSLAAAKSELVEAQTNLKLARAEQNRTRNLYSQGVVSAQQQDRDDAQAEAVEAKVMVVRQQIEAAQGRLAQAQATLRNTPIRVTAALQIQRQIAQARTNISLAQQEVYNAQAAKAQIEAQLNYLVVNSPMAGNVITRSVQPGEVVAGGAPLLTLVNLNQLYLRGFVPASEIAKVKLGQQAQIELDGFTNQPLEATVTRVDPKASFTPENIYFQEDRVKQVFGVELTLKNPQGIAKPGMPADARILLPQTQAGI